MSPSLSFATATKRAFANQSHITVADLNLIRRTGSILSTRSTLTLPFPLHLFSRWPWDFAFLLAFVSFLLSSCNCCSVQALFLISHCVCQSSSLEIVCLPGPGKAVKSDLGAAWHGFHHCATLLLLHPHRVYLIELGVELLELVGLILWSYFYLLFAVFFSLLNHPANCQFIYQLATLLLQSLQFVSCN